jgi:predicted nucleotidyltransferase
LKRICDLSDVETATGLQFSDIQEIKSICSKYTNISEVILFGSRAKGNWKHGSDIDLCIKGEQLKEHDIISISYKLNEETLLPYKFDILYWDKIKNSEIASHIERCGIIIIE